MWSVRKFFFYLFWNWVRWRHCRNTASRLREDGRRLRPRPPKVGCMRIRALQQRHWGRIASQANKVRGDRDERGESEGGGRRRWRRGEARKEVLGDGRVATEWPRCHSRCATQQSAPLSRPVILWRVCLAGHYSLAGTYLPYSLVRRGLLVGNACGCLFLRMEEM